MNPHDREHEEKLQAAAELAERLGQGSGDPAVDAYRLVQRAVCRAAMPALPADFASRIAERMRKMEEGAQLERFLTSLLLLALAVGGAFYLWPLLATMMADFSLRPPAAVPWQLAIIVLSALCAAWMVDRGWVATHPQTLR